jgi:hypothetical protein
LEKAWAKLHGTYKRCALGSASHSFRDVLGAPAKFYEIKETPDMFVKLLTADHEQYLMAASLKATDDEFGKKIDALGLLSDHTYGVIDVYEVESEGKTLKLLKLRNPWGEHEWTGAFGRDSELWTEELKAKVGFSSDGDHCDHKGTFFMCYEDFQKYFKYAHICRFREEYKFNNMRVEASESH